MLNNLYQSLDPVAFTIGPFSARWYGLAYVAGFICVIAIMYVVGKRWKMRFDFDSLCIIMLCAMIGVIVGGRLGYVLFYNWDMYAANPLAILEFSRGGMSFHGGFIGALVAGIVAARMVHMPYLSLVEFGGSAGMEPRHPSQLYEALLEGALLFAILFVMSRKRPPFARGTYFGVFMVGYGICRFLIEFVRQPDAQLGYLWGGWLTMGQVLSVPLIVAGVVLLVYALKTKHPQEGPRLA